MTLTPEDSLPREPLPESRVEAGLTASQAETTVPAAVEWDQFIDELLPDTPNSSKFTKLDFVSPSFVADAFIEKRKDEPLDQLRQLLSTYADRIRSAFVSIIDEDYADFIHLSSNIVGVGRSLDKVLRPLNEAHEEVTRVRNELSATICSLEDKMCRLHRVRKQVTDIDKMTKLEDEMSQLEQRVSRLSDLQPVPRLLALESATTDLLQVERTLHSVACKCKLLLRLKERYTQLVVRLEAVRSLK